MSTDAVVRHLLRKYPNGVPYALLDKAVAAQREGTRIDAAIIDEWDVQTDHHGVVKAGSKTWPAPPRHVVYYILFNGLVKIGTTGNLKSRLSGITHDQLLVTEPGTYALERQRHAQFQRLHYKNEWYRYEGALIDHVAQLKAPR